jgi:hypothetical protein
MIEFYEELLTALPLLPYFKGRPPWLLPTLAVAFQFLIK